MATSPKVIDLISDRLGPIMRGGDAPPATFIAATSVDPVRAAIEGSNFSEFELLHDAEERILFCYFNFTKRPCFTQAVLSQARAIQTLVRGLHGDHGGTEPPLRYLVLGSRAPGVWNLGGDLDLIAALIRDRDRTALRDYAYACCEVGYTNATGLGSDLPVISVGLVQGDALGGGFEAALSSNLIIAERSAKFGFPEILFNLFPGMGAYAFLARRIAPGLAERVIMSGEMYSAEQLYAMGAIDVLAPDGQGLNALYDFIGRGGKHHSALSALYRARRLVSAVTFEELTHVADLWVEAALKLDESGLRRMTRLVTAQDRRVLGHAV